MSNEKRKYFSNLNDNEIKNFLLNKIEEENNKIIKDYKDLSFINDCNNNAKDNKINVVSLFSGAGGLDLGTELAGLTTVLGFDKAMEIFNNKELFDKERHKSIFNILYTNDIFKEANQTYYNNIGKDVFQHQKDIRKVSYFPNNTLVIGGFPCPGFSNAGPRLIDDERNFLYLHYIRVLLQTQPDFFVVENVKGILNLANGNVIKQIIEDFSSAGYTVTPFLVNATSYGVPQARERVFLIGVHKENIEKKYGFKYELLPPTHGTQETPIVTLKDAIGDLETNPGEYFQDSYSSRYLSRNKKKNWDEPSFTILASGRHCALHPSGLPMKKIGKGEKRTYELQGDVNRRLSVKEIQRIQTFPDWYEFSDGYNEETRKKVTNRTRLDKIYKQIGNAVPVLLARAILQPISDFLYEIKPELKKAR